MPQIQDETQLDQNIIRWTKLYRSSLITLVVVATIGVGIGVWKVFSVGNQIKTLIQDGRATRNSQTQATQGYIKCILLLRYDHPELTNDSSKQDVSNALDECAMNVK